MSPYLHGYVSDLDAISSLRGPFQIGPTGLKRRSYAYSDTPTGGYLAPVNVAKKAAWDAMMQQRRAGGYGASFVGPVYHWPMKGRAT